MISAKLLRIFFLIAFLSLPQQAKAYDLGMTPNQVYGLWLNINLAFMELQKASFIDDDFIEQLESIQTDTFTGKHPSDVYELATHVFENVAQNLSGIAFIKYDNWVDDFKIISESKNNEPTPSMVFVLSTEILNLITDAYLKQTFAQKPIGAFFKRHEFNDKTPNDVYGQVLLLQKRINLIVADEN